MGFVTNYDSAIIYYKKNLQGDVTAIVDSNGALKIGYKYDAWGNAASYCSNPNDLLSAITATLFFILNTFTYRGYFYDAESNIYYLQSRYYIPEWGRFLNADVYCDTGTGVIGTNMFAYCENNPVFRIDVNGTYSASKAIEYARKWWNSYNPDYYANTFDCANFVSQCLYAGSYIKMSGVSKWGWHHYYSFIVVGTGLSARPVKWHDISDAWGVVPSLYAWFRNKGYFSKEIVIKDSTQLKNAIKNNSGIKAGCAIIFFQSSDKGYTHAGIVGNVYKDPYWDIDFYSHTTNRDGADNIDESKNYTTKDFLTGGVCRVKICILKT